MVTSSLLEMTQPSCHQLCWLRKEQTMRSGSKTGRWVFLQPGNNDTHCVVCCHIHAWTRSVSFPATIPQNTFTLILETLNHLPLWCGSAVHHDTTHAQGSCCSGTESRKAEWTGKVHTESTWAQYFGNNPWNRDCLCPESMTRSENMKPAYSCKPSSDILVSVGNSRKQNSVGESKRCTAACQTNFRSFTPNQDYSSVLSDKARQMSSRQAQLFSGTLCFDKKYRVTHPELVIFRTISTERRPWLINNHFLTATVWRNVSVDSGNGQQKHQGFHNQNVCSHFIIQASLVAATDQLETRSITD